MEDLADACTDCHFLFDCGLIVFVGFDKDGRPRFRFRGGEPPDGTGGGPPPDRDRGSSRVREPGACYAGGDVSSGEMRTGEVPVPYG